MPNRFRVVLLLLAPFLTAAHRAGDRIRILADTSNDGRADTAKTFVQDTDLRALLGLAVIGNRVIVSASPHLIVYTDAKQGGISGGEATEGPFSDPSRPQLVLRRDHEPIRPGRGRPWGGMKLPATSGRLRRPRAVVAVKAGFVAAAG